MSHDYRFDRFELRPLQRCVLGDGRPVALGARAFDVLLALVEQHGALLSKGALLDRCWPGLVVEEANVHVQISLLRKQFGAGAIATVAGLGYRFALAVECVGQTPAHNLPAARTPFIGREAALAEAEQRLRGTRLLTFTGIGGSGKTRLAVRLAERLLPHVVGGCWFIDLAPLEDATQVPLAVARALGVAQGADLALEARLLDRLRERQALLIFDNCEQVQDGAALLADVLLGGAPQIKIVCTSRHALGLVGEATFAVRPLALPAADADDAGIVAAESVRLFTERAHAATPGLVFDGAALRQVADICRRLDGIPLAIELAAARLKMLSLTQLQTLLDERLRLLSNGPRTPPRQQTLQTVIQWSYEHLGAAEQRLARALAVCSGGCDLAAAVALLGDAGDDMAVLESLAVLADQSLLTVEHVAQTARYLMLETVRQYALERLEDSGEAAAVRDRHRDHFMALAEEMGQQLSGPAPGAAMATLEPERDNLFRALAWCNGAEGARQGLRMVAALRYFWPSCGLLVRGYEVTREALARPGADQCGALRGRALSVASILCTWLGRDHDAIGHAEESLAVFERAGDDQGVARALSYIGAIKSDLGETDQAWQYLERSLGVARRDGDEDVIANALNGLGNVLLRAGEVERAESVFEEVLALRRRLTQPAAEAVAWLNLAATAIEGRRPEAAKQRLVQVWQLVQRVDSRFIGQVLVGMAAGVAALTEEAELALRLDAASKQQRIEIGLAPNIVGGEQARAFARAREALGAFTCASAEQAGREMHYAQTLAEVGAWLDRTAQRS